MTVYIAMKEANTSVLIMTAGSGFNFADFCETLPDDTLAAAFMTASEMADGFFSNNDYRDLLIRVTGDAPKKFKTKRAAAERVFEYMDQLVTDTVLGPVTVRPVVDKPARTRASKGVNLAPKATLVACRQGTKQAALIDALSKGAHMKQLRAAVDHKWSDAALKSALYLDVNNVKGYGIVTTMASGVAVYTLTYPEHLSAPLPHTVKKG